MTTEKQIHELLSMSSETYQDSRFEMFMRWCLSRSINSDNDLQKLLANKAIYSYFDQTLSKYETQFKNAAQNLTEVSTPEMMRNIYINITIQIYRTFPMPLIEEARKLNINSN